MVIVLDPGHGGQDPGAVANGLVEKVINWDLANLIKKKLDPFFVEVIISQPSSYDPNSTTEMELIIPPYEAVKAGADFYLSLHVNAGGGEGFESYTQLGTTRSNTIQTRLHAQIMEVLRASKIKDRGTKQKNLYVLRKCEDYGIPAVLLEVLFIDNQYDAIFLKDPQYLDKLANEIAYALTVIFEIPLRNLPQKCTNN